jgi:hypothetical protein
MSNKIKHIVAILIIIVPFYFVAILQRILFTQSDLLAEKFLALYMILSIIGISVVLLTNKYFLKNNLSVFTKPDRKLIIDVALAFLLLAAFYFIQSLERMSYGVWLAIDIDRSGIMELLDTIFSNLAFSIIIVGPFTWLNEGFAVLSVAFLLNNLWMLGSSKKWVLASILFTALIFSLLQINNGLAAIISSFVLVSFSNFIYYKYRSIFPLLIAGILLQTIDLISYWVYN